MPDTVAEKRGKRKERKGAVVSKSGDKTIVVLVERREPDPKYGKVVRHFKKFHAHDEENKAAPGDVVLIVESRPISKLKRWRLVEIVERRAGKGAGAPA